MCYRQPVILYVEDDEWIGRLVRSALELKGWRVEFQADGLAAWEVISSAVVFDLCIFDHGLPGVSGLDLLRRVRELPHRTQTPVIMFTANFCELEAGESGADLFLDKVVSQILC